MIMTITYGEKSSEFTKNGTVFTSEIPVGLFEEYEQYPILSITTSDGIKTEYIDNIDIAYLYLKCLPNLNAGFHGSTRFTSSRLDVNGRIYVDCKKRNTIRKR